MNECGVIDDKPVGRRAQDYHDFLHICMHPAFRLGFLDAMRGKPFNDDAILDRIERDTPQTALARIGWLPSDLFLSNQRDDERHQRFALAQFRYEEGRLMQVKYGLKCRGWGHPDYPPASVLKTIRQIADERAKEQA